jgi:acetyl-CoA/propionyl-CoA carboxylase biotin carboxyl carrier protein
MLAKVIAHGPDRAAALRRLDRALARLELVGVSTNAAFTRALLARADVRAGEQDTGLLERVLDEGGGVEVPDDLLPAAALAAAGTSRPAGPWWRALVDADEVRVDGGCVSAGGREWPGAEVRFDGAGGTAHVTLGGIERRYAVAVSDETIWISRDGHHAEFRTQPRRTGGEADLVDSLQAPMPGTVLLVHVADGDTVQEGDVLVVLESMKMELSITAPHAGTVSDLALRPGDRVALKQALLAVHADGDGEA